MNNKKAPETIFIKVGKSLYECSYSGLDYFGLTEEELEPLTLRRIDYYCDYRFRDEIELEIIKNIIIKTSDQFYSYKKEIKDEPSKYVVKYLALKKNKENYKDVKLSVEKITVIDKEEDDNYEI